MLLHAEQHRISPDEAEEQLAGDAGYASPFVDMPI